jgi:hypothetical protein
LGALLSSRVANIFLSCTLIGCFSFAKAELQAPVPNINLGLINVSDGPVPLSWMIVNSGSNELRLIRIDLRYPHTLAMLAVGSLLPGVSTEIRGSFNPQNAVGPIYGTLEVVAEYGPAIKLAFKGEVEADIEPKTELKTVIKDINSKTTIITGKPLIFTTKSGAPFVTSNISISGEPFIGAHIAVNDDKLELVPYIYEPSLPNSQTGHTVLKVSFRHAIGTLAYDIPITWERADPLRIIDLGFGAYTVSYTDNCPFKVRSIVVAPGLAYTTQFSDDGLTLLLKPGTPQQIVLKRHHQSTIVKKIHPVAKVKSKVLRHRVSTLTTKSKLKIKSNHKVNAKVQHQLCTGTNPIHKTSGVLIQLETNHPYRSEVIIRDE